MQTTWRPALVTTAAIRIQTRVSFDQSLRADGTCCVRHAQSDLTERTATPTRELCIMRISFTSGLGIGLTVFATSISASCGLNR